MESQNIRQIVVAAGMDTRRSRGAQSIVRVVSEGDLGPAVVEKVTRLFATEKPGALRDELLDILMLAIREALQDHRLTAEERHFISQLKRLFRITEGDFYRLRRTALEEILRVETKRLLTDERIDTAESLHQVELQALFDLSYDQYLDLTSSEVSAVVDRIIDRLERDDVGAAERGGFFQQLSALNAVYRLSPRQHEALARAGVNLRASGE